MRLIVYILACLAIIIGADPALAQGRPTADAPYRTGVQTSRSENISVELVSLAQAASPGSTAIVALRQQIAPGWHTYWRNPGDSGGATTLTWNLPSGLNAGDIIWPLPERQRLLNLVNYGYAGTVYLPVPIQISASARGTVRLNVEADLFVCSAELCIPETFRLALDLPVRDDTAPDTTHGQAIRSVLQSAPRPAGIQARVSQTDGVVTLTATGGPLAEGDPGPVWFYPYQGGQVAHSSLQSGERGPEGLRLVMTAFSGRGDAAPASLAGVIQTARGAFEIEATPGDALTGTTGGALSIAPEKTNGGSEGATPPPVPIWQVILLALAGGLILNLMPCVFPVLAMKAAALTASAHDPRRARRDGLLFLTGTLTTFAVLAGAILALRASGTAIGWGFQLQSPMVTSGLALLIFAVGLNLSGVFHLGSGLQGLGALSGARAHGGAQAFLTGVLAVAVAAPCTAPFMAVALGAALVMPWPAAMMVFLALGLGLGLPYLLISLFPGLLARLPRPGAWMERLRGMLAFPMYGTALWLVWVATRQIGDDGLALLLGSGLMLALSLWLYGIGQTSRARGARSWMWFAGTTTTLLLSVGLMVMATRTLPPPANVMSQSQTGGLPSRPWSPEAVQTALSQGRPVMVDFTADWCVTCKINESGALRSRRVTEAMTASNTLFLVADWTRRDDAITLELQRHGRSGVPLYLVYTPGEAQPRILPQLLTEGLVADALMKAGSTRS